MSAPRIFISYRRNDSAGHAGRLYDALSMRFGEDRVFMDVDQIPIASDFQQVIADALARTDLVLVLIGSSWLSITDRDGRRRLDDPGDLVRLEIVESLRRNVRVLPVLVEGAHMPAPEDLPEALAGLARIQALELSDRRWRSDLDEFLEAVENERWGRSDEPVVDSRPERPVVPGRRRTLRARAWWLAGAALLAVVVVVAIIAALEGGEGGGGGEAADGPDDTVTVPAPAALADKIVFTNVDRGGIMKVGADGSGLVTLTSDGAAPAPSPDGARIALRARW